MRGAIDKLLVATEDRLQTVVKTAQAESERLMQSLKSETQSLQSLHETFEKESGERMTTILRLEKKLNELEKGTEVEAASRTIVEKYRQEAERIQERATNEYKKKVRTIQKRSGMKKRNEIQVGMRIRIDE